MKSGGALLVCGASSGAGKSTVAAGLCRAWKRRGLSVAPFKAQNMSNHAAVTADGGEIGRAQAMQAHASGVEPLRCMNPILLKPAPEGFCHMVVMGEEVGRTDAVAYGPVASGLRSVVLEALACLRRNSDWVVAEGAGGAAEVNLLDRDLVNLPLAHASGMPALLVVDIDRGGAFATAHGTIDLLPERLRDKIVGVVFNRFSGDSSLLESGIAELERRSGVPVLGVLPHLGYASLLGTEDSRDVALGGGHGFAGCRDAVNERRSGRSPHPVRVAAVRTPALANPSDLDPFMIEPDVEVRWVARPDDLHGVDLVVVPGSRATVADLRWLCSSGFAAMLQRFDGWIVGLCGGYQILGKRIRDEDGIESGESIVEGLGMLDTETVFRHPKIVRRSHGSVWGCSVDGYQIRFGRPETGDVPWLCVDGADEGAVNPGGTVYGTSLHGLFDADGFRSQFLSAVAESRGRSYQPAAVGFESALQAQHDCLADWVEAHIPVDRLIDIAASASAVDDFPGW